MSSNLYIHRVTSKKTDSIIKYSLVLTLLLFLSRTFYLACVNDRSSSDDEEEEVFAHHGVMSSLQQRFPGDDLFDNYFHFEDEELTVSILL